MNKKLIFSTLIGILLILVGFLFINKTSNLKNISTNFLNNEQRQIIKKYIFPYRVISQQEKRINRLEKELSQKKNYNNSFVYSIEKIFKKSLANIQLKKNDKIILSNSKVMNKYELVNGFYSGIFGKRPGGFIDIHQDNLLILSSRGILGFSNDLNKLYFKQIKNNLNDFINFKQLKKTETVNKEIILSSPQTWNSVITVRDLFIDKNKIYISYVEQIKLNCWNISVLHSKIDYKNITFKKLFAFEKCDGSNNPKYSNQTGGRIVNFDKNHILLSVGVLGDDQLAQEKTSIKGKIIKININDSSYEIISMGHRNPQGLFFDKEINKILVTEHGPLGGDEINLIDVDKISKNETLNYGWAIVSAGEHYCTKYYKKSEEPCASKYKNFPLYKSHTKHGFIEPLISFVPSIAISEIVKIGKNNYVLGSMGANKEQHKSLYFFQLNDKKKIINLQQVKVFQRVRDLVYKNEVLYLLFEEPSSIGAISLK